MTWVNIQVYLEIVKIQRKTLPSCNYKTDHKNNTLRKSWTEQSECRGNNKCDFDQVRRLCQCVLNSLPGGEREHDAEKTVGVSFNFWALSGYYGLNQVMRTLGRKPTRKCGDDEDITNRWGENCTHDVHCWISGSSTSKFKFWISGLFAKDWSGLKWIYTSPMWLNLGSRPSVTFRAPICRYAGASSGNSSVFKVRLLFWS